MEIPPFVISAHQGHEETAEFIRKNGGKTGKELTIKLKTSISAALFIPKEQDENTNLTMLLMPIRLND